MMKCWANAPAALLFGHALSLAVATQVPLAITAPAREFELSPILEKCLNDTIARILKEHSVPGHSLVLVRPRVQAKVEYGAWGIRNEDGDPMTPQTLVGMGSASKAFTAAAIALLQDDFAYGRNITSLPAELDEFQWNTMMHAILPEEWQLMDKWSSEKATVHDVLSHVSGLPRHEWMWLVNGTLANVVTKMRHLRPAFELRDHWHYNNQHYIVAAYLINIYSGRKVSEFVGDRIFMFLNMTSSTYNYGDALASGHLSDAFDDIGRRVPNPLSEHEEMWSGPGGVMSNVVDLGSWLMYLLHDAGDAPSGSLPWNILSETWRPYTFVKPPAPAPFNGTITYGMGWFQAMYRGHEVIQHGGGLPGVSSSIAFFPGLQLGIGQLSNAGGKFSANKDILWKIIDAVLASEDTTTSGVESSIETSTPPEDPSYLRMTSSAKLHISQPAVYRASRIDISAFVGTYTDPGYGSMTFCASFIPNSQGPSSLDQSRCTDVLAAFQQFNETRPDTLYGFWDRIVSNAFRLVRVPDDAVDQWGNNTFSFRPTNLHPHGYGKNTSAFEMDDLQSYTSPEAGDGRIIFQVATEDEIKETVVEGFGWEGTVDWGVVPERQRKGKTIEERADVWFRKVTS